MSTRDMHTHISYHNNNNTILHNSHEHDQYHHHNHRSFLVGTVHGMAGSAGLILLTLSAFGAVTSGLIFIICFGFGSVLGMFLITLFFAGPMNFALRFKHVSRTLQMGVGAISMLFGVIVVYNIDVVNHLIAH